MVVLPYIKCMTEQLKQVFSTHKIATYIKPQLTLWNLLVHYKYEIETSDKSEVVYKITCNNCEKIYISETGRKLATRSNEHKSEIDELPEVSQTRSQTKSSVNIRHKSAICDHVHQHNYVINWGKWGWQEHLVLTRGCHSPPGLSLVLKVWNIQCGTFIVVCDMSLPHRSR